MKNNWLQYQIFPVDTMVTNGDNKTNSPLFILIINLILVPNIPEQDSTFKSQKT